MRSSAEMPLSCNFDVLPAGAVTLGESHLQRGGRPESGRKLKAVTPVEVLAESERQA